MAPRVSDNPDVEQHHAAQTALTVALAAVLRRLWPVVDLGDLRGSLPRYKAAVAAVTQHYGRGSVSLASEHYAAMRDAVGTPGAFRVPIVDAPPLAQIEAVTDWATGDLWDARLTAPAVEGFDPATVIESVQTKVEGAAVKVALDAGRNELIAAIEADSQARGFARVAKPGACYWCMMLATRGAVYESRESAGVVAASSRWPDAKGEINRYHDNCKCQVVPLFARHYEAPAHVRDAQALWKSSTKGLSGQKAINAFRRAYEQQQRGN